MDPWKGSVGIYTYQGEWKKIKPGYLIMKYIRGKGHLKSMKRQEKFIYKGKNK